MGFLDNDGLTRLWGKITGKFTVKNDSIKSIIRNGTVFTATRADNTTFTFDQQSVSANDLYIIQAITIPAANWQQVTVDGITWYKNDVTIMTIASDHPDIFVRGSGTLPLPTEQSYYNKLKYAVFNPPTLTFYAETPPGGTVYCYVRGAASQGVDQTAALTVPATNWVETTVDGVAWYVNEVDVTNVGTEHPEIFIRGTGTLPSEIEEEAFFKIKYAIGEPTKVKFYAKSAPTTNAYVYARGVQL